jgi:hypothetical protein
MRDLCPLSSMYFNISLLQTFMNKNKITVLVLTISIFLTSLTFNLLAFVHYLNQPIDKLGVLVRDIEVKNMYGRDNLRSLFSLPKGMIVRDASPQGIASAGVFERDRIQFTVIVPKDWVDYSQPDDSINGDELYHGS